MANALSYIKNVGKSVSYASFNALKEMNPVFNDFAETNGQLMNDMYKSVKSLKKNAKKIPGKAIESQYGQFVKSALKNSLSDLKTGKFYNKERIDRYQNEMMDSYGADIDFDFGGNDDFNFDNMDSFDSNEPSTNEMIDIVGEKTSNAINNALARSSEYIVGGVSQSNAEIYKQMNIIYGGIHSGLSTINQNISKLIEFSSEAVTTHFENSSTFYGEITRLDQERNQYLKEIAEGVKQLNNPTPKEKSSYRGTTYSDLVNYDGVVDLSSFIENAKKNFKNNTGGLGDMLSVMAETGGLKSLTASPISSILTMMMVGLTPAVMKKSMDNLNKSVSGLFGTGLLKLNQKARKDGGIWETISNIFGINSSLKTDINPGMYEKGKVPFDGITRKAIVEVIPTYLSKILVALQGGKEDRFDYENGKFVTVDSLREELKKMTTDSANRAASDLDYIVRDKKSSLKFRDKNDQRQFDEDWEAIKQYMYKNQVDFDTRNKKLNGSSFGLKGGMASDVNVQRLQKMLDGNPEILRYANQMFRERDNQNRRMRELEDSGAGALISLFNGSAEKESKTQSTGISEVISGANNAAISELIAIHKELSYIRLYGTGGKSGSTKNKKGSKRPNFDSFDIPKTKSGKDAEYDKNHEQKIDDSLNNVKDEKLGDEYSDIIDDAKEETASKKQAKSFSQRMSEASGMSAKMSVLVQSASELAKKPAKFVVSMLDKADERLYDLIYGPKDDKTGKKSFIGKLFKGLEGVFDKFSNFVTEKILEPLRDKFSGKLSEGFNKIFEKIFKKSFDTFKSEIKSRLFGKKDKDGKGGGLFRDFIDGFKDEMKGAFGWVKNTFKGFGDWLGVTKKLNAQGKEKQERNSAVDDEISRFKDILKRAQSNMSEAATGLKRVNKTGLAVISEGEMIIPPDMNPYNVAKRKRNEKKVKNDLKNGISSILEYAEGTKNTATGEPLISEEQRKHNNETKARIASEKIEKLKANKESFSKEDYEEGRNPFFDRVFEQIGSAASNLYQSMKNASETFGMTDDDKEKFEDNAKKFIGSVKKHGTTMAAGATIGAGLSVITGLVGGPLVGAAVGAATGLLSKSESVQKMLFGDFEEDGKTRKGGLLSKNISNNINKYFPDMGKGATIGGILTALPFVPGGPVAGIIVGSAMGFAKNNDYVQKMLFGEIGDDGKRKGGKLGTPESFQKKVRSLLPKMGAGALAGLVAGPFGITANLLLGSAVGFASDTDKFKELIFGKKDENGKLQGGLFGKLFGFIDKKIIDPLVNIIDPLKRRFEDFGKSILNKITDGFKKHVWEPIDQFIKDRIINPIGNALKKAFGAILKPIKWLISKPFEMIGGLGTRMREKDVKTGKARYMSAQERNQLRQASGDIRMAGDKFADVDKTLAGLNTNQLSQMQDILSGVKSVRGNIKNVEKESYNNVYNAFYGNEKLRTTEGKRFSREAMRMVRSQGYKQAEEFVQNATNIDQETKDKILKTIQSEAAKLETAKKMRSNVEGTSKDITKMFNETYGFNLDDSVIKGLTTGEKGSDAFFNYVAKELEVRKSEDKEKEKNKKDAEKAGEVPPTEAAQEQRHKEILDPVTQINENFKKLLNLVDRVKSDANISDEKYKDELKKQEERFDIPEDGVYVPDEGDKFINNVRSAKFKAGQFIRETASNVKTVAKQTKDDIKDYIAYLRNTPLANKYLGDKNKRRYYGRKKVPTILSEGEEILDVDKVEEQAEGGVAGDGGGKQSTLLKILKNVKDSIAKLTAVTVASAYKDGVDVDSVDTDKKDPKTYLGKVKNKFKKATSTFTQFVNGLPLKFKKDKNGDDVLDSASSENKDTMKVINEQQETQKGILSGITGLYGNVRGFFGRFFGKKEDDDKESLFSKLFNNLSTTAKVTVGIAGALGVAGWAKDTIAPVLKDFWDKHLGPYLSDAWDGKKDGFGKAIYFFNPKNPDGLFENIRKFFKEEFPDIMKTASTYISDGLSWSLENVLPSVISTLITNLPTIITGVFTGLFDGLNNLLFGKKKKTASPPKIEGYDASNAISTTKNLLRSTKPNTTPSWYDKTVKLHDSSIDKIDNNASQNEKRASGGGSISFDGEKRLSGGGSISFDSKKRPSGGGSISFDGETETIGSNTLSKTENIINNNSLPKAFSYVNKGYRNKAIEEYEKVKDNIVSTPHGNMTVRDVLNSDLVFYDAGGYEIHGYEYLNYDDTAKSLGIDLELSEKETAKNTKKDGGTNSTILGRLGNAGIKSFMRGLAGTDIGVKGASKVISGSTKILSKGVLKPLSKIPVAGNAVKLVDKVVTKTGNTLKNAPKFLNNAGAKTSNLLSNLFNKKAGKEIIEEGVENLGKEAVEQGTKTLAKEAAEKAGKEIVEEGASKLLKETAEASSNGMLQKFVVKAKSVFQEFFSKKAVSGKFADALKECGETVAKEQVENFIQKILKELGEYLIKKGAKSLGKAAVKLAGYLSTATLLMIADALWSFGSGYRNANSMLGVIEQPNAGVRFLCGLVNALNSVFCLGLVPVEFIIGVVTDAASACNIGIFKNLKSEREAAQAEVDRYNAENGTNHTVESYNKKDRWTTKAWNWFKDKTINNFTDDDRIRKALDLEEDEKVTVKQRLASFVGGALRNATFGKDEDQIALTKFAYTGINAIRPSTNINVAKGSGIVGRGSSVQNKMNKMAQQSQINQFKQNANVSDNTFISQIDPRYRDQKFNISGDTQVQTLGDTGCAPAAAAMTINALKGQSQTSMEEASRDALKYKVKNDGVNATYFNDEFSRHGINAQYITSQNSQARKQEIAKQLLLNNRVVLMGQDVSNTSKSNSPFGPNPHYVVANGLSSDGKYIYINDPEAKTPNIKYSTDRILGSTKLGISASIARGSNISKIKSKLSKYNARGSYGTNTIQYKVWSRLRAAGYREYQVAGIMGNIEQESHFDPAVIEKGSGVGFGICQWSRGRRTALESYASSIGKSASDIDLQIDFLIAEMTKGGGANGYATYQFMGQTYEGRKWPSDSFNNAKDIVTATKAFCYCWERPNEKDANISYRIESANKYYEAFTGLTAPASYVGNTSGSSDATSTSNSGGFLSNLYGLFGKLATAFGLQSEDTTSESQNIDTSMTYTSADGNVSSVPEYAEKQKALVNQMYSIQGKLKYAQGNAKYPGPRDVEQGSSDCSQTVQWAYKKILGVDPGDWTGAQRESSNTFTVVTNTSDESKLQLGDLILKQNPGHVEMYAGNGQTIGHGGPGLGPTVKPLDTSGKYDLVRRWVGFKNAPTKVSSTSNKMQNIMSAKGSGLFIGRGSNDVADNGAYSNALKHIKPNQFKSLLPLGYDSKEIEQGKVSVMQYNNNKLSTNSISKQGKEVYVGKAANIEVETQDNTSKKDKYLQVMQSMLKLLVEIVTNTDQLNTIVKLIGEYVDKLSSSDGSQESKNATILAKQNLINAMRGNDNSNDNNAQLMKLIQSTELIAKQ